MQQRSLGHNTDQGLKDKALPALIQPPAWLRFFIAKLRSSGHGTNQSLKDEDQLSELRSGNGGLSSVLNLPETLRQRSSGMVDNLELGTPLGRGSYGKVYKGAPSVLVGRCPACQHECSYR